MKKLSIALILAFALLVAGCPGNPAPTPGPTPPANVAYFEITNSTYDNLTVVLDGTTMPATLFQGETHSYNMGAAGYSHRVQIYIASTAEKLNDAWVAMPAGITTWDVYDNAPVVLVQNNLSSDFLVGSIDGTAVSFAIEKAGQPTVFDSAVYPGETGFYLVDLNWHRVIVDEYTTDIFNNPVYVWTPHDDTRAYYDGTHVLFAVP